MPATGPSCRLPGRGSALQNLFRRFGSPGPCWDAEHRVRNPKDGSDLRGPGGGNEEAGDTPTPSSGLRTPRPPRFRNASHLGRPHLGGMPLPMEQDEAPDRIDVGLLGADAVVQPPDDIANLIEQPGFPPNRGRILKSVHAVFPYGGTRPLVQSPWSSRPCQPSPPPPPRYMLRPPASTRWGRAAFSGARPGRSRAKSLTRRMLHFASGLVAVL